MLIRSQNKKRLINFANVKEVSCEDKILEICATYVSGGWNSLGEYSTREKAIKVLNMIQEEYQKPFYQNVVAENEKAIYQNKVFQMPQDSEV